MKIVNPFFFLFVLICSFFSDSTAQENTIVGKVVTFEKYPLNKAVVTANNDTACTNTSGIFKIVCQKKDKILIQANGFYPKKLKVKNFTDTFLVNLKFIGDDKSIEIATGFNHINKDQLTYAISHFEADKYNYASYTTIFDLMEGRFSSVSITSNGINIRGSKTLQEGNTPALLIVDGVNVDLNIFANIPTTQVRSINVLKGASAARYGAKGFSGVVIVTTKSAN